MLSDDENKDEEYSHQHNNYLTILLDDDHDNYKSNDEQYADLMNTNISINGLSQPAEF